MTHCSQQLTFGFYKDKQLVADFKGGQITSDAGLLAVRQLAEELGWLREAAGVLSDPRDPARTVHQVLEMLQQRVFGMIGGYEDCNDHDRLRSDAALKLVAGRGPEDDPLASQPTLSRFENWVRAREVAKLNRLLVGHYIGLFGRHTPREIVLDVDPTDDPCHGHQQLALFNGFYSQYMYFPLLVYERQSGLLLGARLRAGNAHSARGVRGFLKPIVERLRKAFPKAKIILRADAGFAVPGLYEFCERQRMGYLIGMPTNAAFDELTTWAVSWLSERLAKDGKPHRWVGGFRHRAASWTRSRRILYKAEVNGEGTNRRFVVTNLPGHPRDLYPVYCDRGTSETFIEQLKNALKADRLSCHSFVANAFRLQMYALAYNQTRVFGGLLAGTALENASVETIRSRLLKLGARICQSVRRVWVHMASGFPLREVLGLVLERMEEFIHGGWGRELARRAALLPARAGPQRR